MFVLSCYAQETKKQMTNTKKMDKQNLEYITFGGGCFWCVDSVLDLLKGVESTTSGYAGGHTKNPTYEEVCTGKTGHAEVVQMAYDPKTISYEQLMDVFYFLHDPTQLNRQGNDIGTQYRSVIYYTSEAEKQNNPLLSDDPEHNLHGFFWNEQVNHNISGSCSREKDSHH